MSSLGRFLSQHRQPEQEWHQDDGEDTDDSNADHNANDDDNTDDDNGNTPTRASPIISTPVKLKFGETWIPDDDVIEGDHHHYHHDNNHLHDDDDDDLNVSQQEEYEPEAHEASRQEVEGTIPLALKSLKIIITISMIICIIIKNICFT